MQECKSGSEVVIGCVTENRPKYLAQALRLLQSIRWFGGELAGASFMVCTVESLDDFWAREFRRYGAEIRLVPRFSQKHPQSNKLRFLEQPDLVSFERAILLDCDTIVVADFFPLIQGNVFQAKIADAVTVDHQIFEGLFAEFNLPLPQQDQVTTVTGEVTIPYFNAGVLVFSPRHFTGLVPQWLDLTRRLLERFELLGESGNFCEQASLSLAIAATGTPFSVLGNEMNFPTHFDGTFPALVDVEPQIVHYHWRVASTGAIIPSGYPRVDERIALFNDRLRQEGPQLNRPVFVIGPMRNGTTLLADLLGLFDGIAHCGFELKDVWSREGGVPTASAKTRDTECHQLSAADVQDGQAYRLKSAFSEIAKGKYGSSEGRFFLNKNPHLCNKLPFVAAIFPDARFIWMFRDLPFVVASLKALFDDVHRRQQTWHYWPEATANERFRCWQAFHQEEQPSDVDSRRLFPGGDVLFLAEYWLESHSAIHEFFTSSADGSNYLRVDYDDLVADCPATLTCCAQFIGVPSEAAAAAAGDIRRDRNEMWSSRLSSHEIGVLKGFIMERQSEIETLGAGLAATYIEAIEGVQTDLPVASLPKQKISGIRKSLFGSRSICILGMHRSGTSTVSRAINLLGAYLGEDHELGQAAPDNPEGFWERLDIVTVHDRLLADLRQRWDSAISLPEGWHRAPQISLYREKLRSIVSDAFSGRPLWAWKDPRTCILLPLWRDILADVSAEMAVVYVIRNPADVANSLSKRNNFPIERSYGIWLNYNLSALKELAGEPLVFISYDNLLDDPENQMRRLAQRLSIPWPADETILKAEVASFLRKDLRHSKSTDAALRGAPQLVNDLHSLLVSVAEDRLTVDATFFAKVTTIANNYRERSEPFRWDTEGHFQNESFIIPSLGAEADKLQRTVDQLHEVVAQRDLQLTELDQQLAERNQRIYALLNSLSWGITAPFRWFGSFFK